MAMRRTPPDILITTPESLYLMLTSQAREMLRGVEAVIVDEIHAVAATKRGAHLALTLERLSALQDRRPRAPAHRPVRDAEPARGGRPLHGRPAAHVPDRRRRRAQAAGPADPGPGRVDGRARAVDGRPRSAGSARRRRGDAQLDLAGDLPAAARAGPRAPLDDRLRQQPPRRRAPRAAAQRARRASADRPRPPRLAGARGAHGRRGACSRPASCRAWWRPRRSSSASTWAPSTSCCRSSRRSPSPAACSASAAPATPSATPPRAASSPSSAPTCSSARSSSSSCARAGSSRPSCPRNALDVLAQQIVAIAASAERGGDGRWPSTTCTRSSRARTPTPSCRASCSRTSSTCSTGATPARSSASCAPRIVWDRVAGTIRARKGARQLAVANAGTIPDRGLFAVVAARRPPRRRARRGDGLRGAARARRSCSARRRGASRRSAATASSSPPRPASRAPCRSGRATASGRPKELGQEIGAFARWAVDQPAEALERDYDLDALAAAQPPRLPARAAGRDARHPERPHDRRRALPRRDRRLAPVRPLAVRRPRPRRVGARAERARIRDELGLESDAIWSDDGIIVHLPDADEPPGADLVLLDPDEVEDAVVAELGASALFGARFRENAGRALLIPRAYPGKRTPLWQQRLKCADAARGRQALRRLPDHPRDLPRVPARRARRARAGRAARAACTAASCRSSRSRRRPPRRSPPRCCSTTSRPTCTRATRPTPSAARPRCRSTATCCASCSARRSCATSSTPTRSTQVEADLQHRSERTRAETRDALADVLRRVGDLTRPRSRERVARRPRRRGDAARPRRRAPRRAAARRRRGALDRRRRRRPVPRRARRRPARRAARGVPRRRPRRARQRRSRATRAPTGRSRPPSCATATASTARRRWRELERAGDARPRRAAARRHASASGATPRSCAGCAARRWPCCARRSRPPTSARSRASCRAGRASTATRRRAPASTACARCSSRCRAWRCPPRSGSATCCRGASAPTRRRGSTSCAPSGEVVWVGAGALGRNSGPRGAVLPRGRRGDRPGRRRAATRRTSAEHEPAPRAPGRRRRASSPTCWPSSTLAPEELQEALWDLVWAGEVTNDAWAPLRAPRLTLARAQRARRPRSAPAARFGARRTRRRSAQVQGRWSLTSTDLPRASPSPRAAPPHARRAAARALRHRHPRAGPGRGHPGRLLVALRRARARSRRSASAAAATSSRAWAARSSRCPGAVERLRAQRAGEEAPPLVLAATDPAQPYGAALPWPKRDATTSSGARSASPAPTSCWPAPSRSSTSSAAAAACRCSSPARRPAPAPGARGARRRSSAPAAGRKLSLERVDGEPVVGSRVRGAARRARLPRRARAS